MKSFFKNTFLISLLTFLLIGCQSVNDALTGKKSNNSDEFLVEKKNPLVLPPNFNELPEPKNTIIGEEDSNQIDFDIKDIFKTNKTSVQKTDSKNMNQSLEESIIKKIKNN